MDRDHFIITVYCLVCENYRAILDDTPLRQAGFAPALTNEEVITIEICGEYFKCATDKDIFDYFQANYPDWFPHLNDRTLFVRQAANLWWIKTAIQRRLTWISGQADDPVYTRSRRDRCFKPEADYGYCAAKDLHYYGFKLGLREAHSGLIIAYPLLPARPHDIQFVEDLTTGFAGCVSAAKGFIDAWRQVVLEERRGVVIVTPRRKGMKKCLHPKTRVKVCMPLRKRVETVGAHLIEQFAIVRIRARDLWHYQHRLIRKVLAHTIGVFLNLKFNRAPFDLDGLLSV